MNTVECVLVPQTHYKRKFHKKDVCLSSCQKELACGVEKSAYSNVLSLRSEWLIYVKNITV